MVFTGVDSMHTRLCSDSIVFSILCSKQDEEPPHRSPPTSQRRERARAVAPRASFEEVAHSLYKWKAEWLGCFRGLKKKVPKEV